METTSCLKSVVSAATLYKNNPADSQVVQLQRQLDVLISITSKQQLTPLSEVFTATNLLVTECFTSLISILGETGTKYSLAEKILALFTNLAKESKICHSLHHTFQLTPCLATYLCQNVSSSGDPIALLCVRLLQKLTYHGKVQSTETFVEDLIKFLIRHIQGKEGDLLVPCLGLLAYLLRQNFAMQNLVKNMENVKSFCKCLMSFLSASSNQTVNIFCLSILASLFIHDDLGKMLFSGTNINQTFHLMFSILVKGDADTRTYAVDLFLDMLKYTRLQHSLIIYQNLTSCIHRVLLLLCDKDEDSVVKILELLLAMCGVNEIRAVICRSVMDPPQSLLTAATASRSSSSLPDPFSAVLHWIKKEHTSIQALHFLREIYQESVDLGLSADVPLRTADLLPLVTDILKLPASNSSISPSNPRKVATALQILIVLCGDDTLRADVAKSVDAKLCASLVEWQFSATSSLEASQSTPSTYQGSSTSSTLVLDPSEEDIRGGGGGGGGMQVVLYALQLMMLQAKHVNTMKTSLHKLLQESRIVSFLSYGLASSDRELVQIALAAVSMGAALQQFPTTVLGDALAVQNGRCRISSNQSGYTMNGGGDTVHSSTFSRSGGGGGGGPSSRRMTDLELEQSVSSIIDKMQKGLELKDVPASDMISVYEVSLQSLKTKENHLQDLLEAKSLALEQADRLIAQYRNRAHEEAKAHQLRLIVKATERSCEELREQRNELVQEREQLRGDVEQMQQEIHSVSEQVQELEDERSNLCRQLKEKEQKVAELQKSLKKAEERHKRVEKDRDQLNVAIDKLRDNLATTEQQKKELQHQVSSLECVCRQHEASIKEKDALIKTQKSDIEKHAQVTSLIRNLTSGMSPGDFGAAVGK